MTKSEFLKLSEIVNEDEKIKLRVLYGAVVGNLKDYKAKYSQANLRAWQAAEKALEEYAERLSDSRQDQLTFKTIKEVFKYLKSRHPKAVQSTVYLHFKKGILKKDSGGKFIQSDIDAYAAGHVKGKKKSARQEINQEVPSGEQNTEDDAGRRIKIAQAEHWETKTKVLRGLYVEKESFEMALAERAMNFKSDIENFIRSHASEMCHLVKGDDLLVPDLIDFWLERSEVWLGRYSK